MSDSEIDECFDSDADVDFSDGSEDDMEFDSDGEDVNAVDGDENLEVEILTPADIIQTQIKSIEEINEIFQIPPQTARNLLHHFNWDKERLLERYYGGDVDTLFEEAQCVNPHKTEDAACSKPLTVDTTDAVCDICMCDYERTGFSTISCCGASYCHECWEEYVSTQVVDEGKAYIPCPSTDCDKLIDEFTVTKLISNPAVLSKYQSAVARVFVVGNKKVKFCPAAGCDNAVKVSHPAPRPVQCKCSHVFCFQCTQPPHDPVRCEMLRHWIKKCEDDSETSNWISANTKECPKCRATIEKNGGCNHMTCSNLSCKYDFCWVCLGEWAPHGSSWYNCNKFNDKSGMDARSAESQSRASLERYLFYFNRYANHQNSLRLESKLKELVEHRMGDIQKQTGISWIEVQFLAKAVETLRECRTTLMYTYVFAFYLAKNSECNIFEDNQKNLEMVVETLSGYLEREQFTMDKVADLRQEVLDKTKYCEQRCQVLLKHVKEGMERDVWEYQPKEVSDIMARLV